MKQKLLIVLFVLAFSINCEGERGKRGVAGITGPSGIDGLYGIDGIDGIVGPEGPGEPGTNLTIECQKPAKENLKLCQDLSAF